MASFGQKQRVSPPRLRGLAAPAVAVLWLLGGCVDTTPPWEKVTPAPGTGGAVGAGTGGQAGDGPRATGGASDTGAGGAIDVGSGGAGGGVGGASDAPAGGGGAVDLGAGGAGGMGDAGIDLPLPGTGGAAGENDGAADVLLPGTGGAAGSAGATGGTAGSAGATGRGGAGGAAGTGGASGAGGTTTPDAGPDLPSDPAAGIDTDPLLSALAVYYNFEGAGGATLPDLSGSSNYGTLSAGALPDGGATTLAYEFVASKAGLGNALRIHKGAIGYVSVPVGVFRGATDITIAYWVNIATSQSWQRMLDVGVNANLSANTTANTKYLNMVPKNLGSNMLFSITNNGFGSEQTLSAPSLSAGTWTHLAVVLAAGTGGTLYVNGASVATNASLTFRPSPDLDAMDYAFIGRSQFSADPAFDGTVDEFRVYRRALSATEIQALYAFTGP
jgi:hypothetical protein